MDSQPPFFDSGKDAWVLSRYADVLAALRASSLRQEGPQKAPSQIRKDVLASQSPARIAAWQDQIDPLAERIFAQVSLEQPVDLVSDVLRPWSLAVTAIVLGLDESAAGKLAALDPRASTGSDDHKLPALLDRLRLAARRRLANLRLQRLLRCSRVRGAQSLFLGLSQTLPDFLAAAWLALLENPAQIKRLRAEPALVPRAVEELLRHSGPVHTLTRKAECAVNLAGTAIAGGDRVLLKLAQANRDPGQFCNPDSLELERRNGGHIALGAGSHSCAGAQLLRLAAISATRAFVSKMADAKLVGPVTWRHGSTLDSPSSLRVQASRH